MKGINWGVAKREGSGFWYRDPRFESQRPSHKMFKKIINFLSLYGKDILKKNKTGIKNICKSKDVKRIFSILTEEGNENHVRFVGGCVRKFINGESIDDIDLATIFKPNEV